MFYRDLFLFQRKNELYFFINTLNKVNLSKHLKRWQGKRVKPKKKGNYHKKRKTESWILFDFFAQSFFYSSSFFWSLSKSLWQTWDERAKQCLLSKSYSFQPSFLNCTVLSFSKDNRKVAINNKKRRHWKRQVFGKKESSSIFHFEKRKSLSGFLFF